MWGGLHAQVRYLSRWKSADISEAPCFNADSYMAVFIRGFTFIMAWPISHLLVSIYPFVLATYGPFRNSALRLMWFKKYSARRSGIWQQTAYRIQSHGTLGHISSWRSNTTCLRMVEYIPGFACAYSNFALSRRAKLISKPAPWERYWAPNRGLKMVTYLQCFQKLLYGMPMHVLNARWTALTLLPGLLLW